MENIFRITGYGILFVINLLLFYFLHSHFTFIVMVMMLAAPVLSLIMGYILRNKVSVQVCNTGAKNGYGIENQEAFFKIKINNPTPFVSLDTKLTLCVENSFFKTEGTKIVSVPIHAFKGYTLELPVIPHLPGIVTVKVTELRIKDMVGFHFFKKSVDSEGELIVMPVELSDSFNELPGLEMGMLESEESNKRGNDFSDVQEIREYIPGDKLMSIHWKLSAKRDILMVKDRVSMSDRQMVVLPELCNADMLVLYQIITATYSVVCKLVKDKTTVRLLYWSSARFEYEDIRIDYLEDVNAAFARMFYENTYQGYDEAASYMANVHPEMKAFVHVTGDGKQAVIYVRENS